MPDTRYLKRRVGKRRSGERWYIRVPVLTDLRGRFGRLEAIERALNTGDLREAQRRRHAVVAAILADFDRARETRPEDVAAAARQSEFGRAYAGWRQAYLEHGRGAVQDQLGVLVDDQFAPVDERPGYVEHAPAPCEAWQRRARSALRQLGAEVTPEAVERVAGALLEAHVEAAEAVLEGREPPGHAGRGGRTHRPEERGIGFKEAAERYVAERMRDPAAAWTAQTRKQNEATFRLFADHVGDAPLAAIGRDDVAGFLSTIARLHPDYARSPKAKGVPLRKLLDRFPGPPGLSNKSLNRHTSALSGLFRWARRAGLIEGENPASEQMLPTGQREKKRQAYSVAELRTLFGSPLLTGAGYAGRVRPKRHSTGTAMAWLPLLGAFTGARLDELCSLRVADVREEGGILYLDLAEHDGRRLKTAAAARRVPVHSQLLRVGFPEYVEHVRAGGQEYLFPSLKPGGPDGKRSWYAGKAFTAHRRNLGLDRPGLVFHSLRNTVATALHNAGVAEHEAVELLGHEKMSMSYGLYSGGLSLARLQAVVESIRYDGLDLSHLSGNNR